MLITILKILFWIAVVAAIAAAFYYLGNRSLWGSCWRGAIFAAFAAFVRLLNKDPFYIMGGPPDRGW